MKSIAVLGTASNVGKSWLVTALGAWLRRKGYKVAPFKAQNMSNNSYVTLEGGEIGRAQAVQAQACGLRPIAAMNPILLKPTGGSSQLVILGEATKHIKAKDYYQKIDSLWQIVTDCLKFWHDRCDVLLLEGAGSPVELNLMDRDIVNLKPIEYLNGKWILVGDIEKGGVFAQIIGTYQLLPPSIKQQGLGFIVNKFRGDLSLFADARDHFHRHIPTLNYLGVLPFAPDLQPESEDSLCRDAEEFGTGEKIAWIRFPHLSNSQDILPWKHDQGVRNTWIKSPLELRDARVIVLPGSKDTIGDLQWLRQTKLDETIVTAANNGVIIVGICGGYQMLGKTLTDRWGRAGSPGTYRGLGLLPIHTEFTYPKTVKQVEISYQSDRWQGYEIHMGKTTLLDQNKLEILDQCNQEVYISNQQIIGTYIHGLFESPQIRKTIIELAKINNYKASDINWQQHQQILYDRMVDFIESHLKLNCILEYLEI